MWRAICIIFHQQTEPQNNCLMKGKQETNYGSSNIHQKAIKRILFKRKCWWGVLKHITPLRQFARICQTHSTSLHRRSFAITINELSVLSNWMWEELCKEINSPPFRKIVCHFLNSIDVTFPFILQSHAVIPSVPCRLNKLLENNSERNSIKSELDTCDIGQERSPP